MTKSNASYKKGDVVDAPFPYQSDSQEEKYRPVLVLAPTRMGGLLCAYITTKSHRDGVIPILAKDFKEGMLGYDASYIQPSTVKWKFYPNWTKLQRWLKTRKPR